MAKEDNQKANNSALGFEVTLLTTSEGTTLKAETAELLNKDLELQELIKLATLTFRTLRSDFDYAVSQWCADRESQFWARTSIRCLCVAIEATLFTFRKMAEQLATLNKVQFSQKEIEILTEKRIVKENGVETTRPNFLPIQVSVIKSFRLFAKSFGVKILIQQDRGFVALLATFDVRNRLMHPKNVVSLEVRESDLRTADEAMAWFNKIQTEVVAQCKVQIGARGVEQQNQIKRQPTIIS